MSVVKDTLKKIVLRSVGTVVLAAGFVLMVGRAPFVNAPDDVADRPASDAPVRYAMPATGKVGTGALDGPNLPPSPEEIDENVDVNPSLGLFNARFAATGDSPGFATEEHEIAGPCAGAGLRFIDTTCPDCQLIDAGPNAEVLLWSEDVDGNTVIRSVSRHCINEPAVGVSVVATLRFEDGPLNFASGVADRTIGRIPLVAGATRVASIDLGQWTATYDEVARPSSALLDMTTALEKWGWRKVAGAPESNPKVFEGQRVFTNAANATCVISLTKQDDVYQLLTVINSRA